LRSAAWSISRKDQRECLTCPNNPVKVGFEKLARVVDHRRIEHTGIDAPDPGVIDQQRDVITAECRRSDGGGICYVELDRYNPRQIDAVWVADAGIETFSRRARAMPSRKPNQGPRLAPVTNATESRNFHMVKLLGAAWSVKSPAV
jgi:hypothetical protein